jgi:hypothetical protein
MSSNDQNKNMPKNMFSFIVIDRIDVNNTLKEINLFCDDISNLISEYIPERVVKIPMRNIRREIEKTTSLSNRGLKWAFNNSKTRTTGSQFFPRLLNHIVRCFGKKNIRKTQSQNEIYNFVIRILKRKWKNEMNDAPFFLYAEDFQKKMFLKKFA